MKNVRYYKPNFSTFYCRCRWIKFGHFLTHESKFLLMTSQKILYRDVYPAWIIYDLIRRLTESRQLEFSYFYSDIRRCIFTWSRKGSWLFIPLERYSGSWEKRVDCEGVVRIQFHFNIIFQTARFILKNRRQVECAIKRGRAGLINSNKALLLGRMALWPHDSLDGQGHSSRASPAMTVVENYHKKECVSTLFRAEYISKLYEYRHNF